MATAKINRKRSQDVERVEFVIPTVRVLQDLINPLEIASGDTWSYVDGGPEGLIVIRDRIVRQNYDDNGNPIPSSIRNNQD